MTAELPEWAVSAAKLRGVRFSAAEPGWRERRMNLSQLPAERKRALWARLQAERPALARLLLEPLVAELRRVFQADVLIERFEDGP